MNLTLLVVNILTLLAFLVHAIMGTRELTLLEPDPQSADWEKRQEKWTMTARCGWHWISVDLLFASIAMGLINFSDVLPSEQVILQMLSLYFLGYAIVWLIAIAMAKSFKNNYLKLGQWILLLAISGLIWAST